MLSDQVILRALRGEVAVDEICRAAGIDLAEFRRERDALLRRRLPPSEQRLRGGVSGPVEILRDQRGIPYIYAGTTADLYFGLGFAMAQDRLWQMDFFRRRGLGTLAAVLGPAYLSSDVTHRTLGLDRIAEREVGWLDEATASVLNAFIAGINRWLESIATNLPIEFDLLDYQPEPWTVRDILVALRGFWWSLNGRIQSIVAAEAASLLPPGPLRDAYLTPNLPDERILPAGTPYPVPGLAPAIPPGAGQSLAGSDDGAAGSNNWAVGRGRTGAAAMLGSDPHQPFALPANWYECRLVGPENDVAGAAWAGAPGVWFGRNRRIAWGLTNNNASTRDLYVEEVNPSDPRHYRDGATWRMFVERRVEIAVRGQNPEALVVRETVRGPIVNHLVPSVRPDGDPPLSLRWIGQEHVDDVRASLAIGRAQNWDEFRAALRDWSIPTFNWGYADVDGNVGYQCASRMPLRGRVVRGYREANNPEDQWLGYVPFEAQPSSFNPPRGFTSSANNNPLPDDYPYPYYGAFASGERAIRVRETIEQAEKFDQSACMALQNDVLSVQARQLVPALVQQLAGLEDPDVQLLRGYLATWDYRYKTDAIAPACFEMFLGLWKTRIAEERFPSHLVSLAAGQGSVFARLLEDDELPWFRTDKKDVIRECATRAVGELRRHFGADPAGWTWEKVHRAHWHHPLSNPALADVFDVGPRGVSGCASTVRNTGLGANPLFSAESGAEYRLIVDLANPTCIWATQNVGQSGQPGSPHYQDQLPDWARGDYHVLNLERSKIEAERAGYVRLEP